MKHYQAFNKPVYHCSAKVKSLILHYLFIQLLKEKKNIAAIK